jgi:beta-mannosidase
MILSKSIKGLIPIAILALLLSSCSQKQQSAMVERIEISANWAFTDKNEIDWLPANVPGTVHTDLLNNRIISDPFFGCNEKNLQWIGERDWIYVTQFNVDSTLLSNSNINLIFEGLDTFAEVILNNQKILNANNMHREWVVNCKDILKLGNNTLEVHFQSALNNFLTDSLALGYPLPGGRWNFARKAAYHFGWDWGPRFITAGIYKPIYLEVSSTHRPSDLHIFTKDITEKMATIELSVKIESEFPEGATLKVIDKKSKKIFKNQSISLTKGDNDYLFNFVITNPKLWWSNGIGEPYIYDLIVEITSESGYSYTKEIPFGVRTLRTVLEDDEIGKALYVELNGVKVFMKGANYIPQHSFVTEVTDNDYNRVIEMARESNMNMIRVWGGGVYEKDIFYELCNRNGILVWQDFMFACAMYPGNDKYVENVRQEAIHQVKRLRNHTNIALWCGNNEADEGWHNWGWQKAYGLSKKDSATIWEGYKRVFHQTLPQVLEKYDPQRFYLSTSPLHGWGRSESMIAGSAHYWGVWWGVQPADMYLEKVPRFMSEYGLQAMPAIASIRQFQTEDDDYLFSNSLKCHQKHPTGYETIDAYLKLEDLYPQTLEEFIHQSQIVQAKGIGLAIEAHRRAMPRCMGTLYWQLNDCWPVTSWSGTDVSGNWKALQYKVRELFDDIMVSITDYKGQFNVFVVSDRLIESNGRIEVSVVNFLGNRRILYTEEITIEANSSRHVITRLSDDFLAEIDKTEVLIEAVFTDSNKKSYTNQKFLVPFGKVKLPKATISKRIEQTKGGFKIHLKPDAFAAQVQLYLTKNHAWFNNNFINLFPNKEETIFCQTDLSIEEFKEQLRVIMLK